MKVAWIVGILMAFSFISLASASCTESLCNEEGGFCCGSTCCYGTCISGVCSDPVPPAPGHRAKLSGTFNAGDIGLCGDVVGDIKFNADVQVRSITELCDWNVVCFRYGVTEITDGCYRVTANNVKIDGNNKMLDIHTDLRFTKGAIFSTSTISNLIIDNLKIRNRGIYDGSAAVWLQSATNTQIKNSYFYRNYQGTRRAYGVYVSNSPGTKITDTDIESAVPVYCTSSSGLLIKDSTAYPQEGEIGGISSKNDFATIKLSSCSDATIENSEITWDHTSTGACVEAISSSGLELDRLFCESNQRGVTLSSSSNSIITSPRITSNDYSLFFGGASGNAALRFDNGVGYLRSTGSDSVRDTTATWLTTVSEFYMKDSNARVEWVDATFKRTFQIDGDIEFGGFFSSLGNYLELNESYFTKGGYTQIRTTPIDVVLYNVPTQTYTTPVLYRNYVKCDAGTSPACVDISGLSPPSSNVSWQVSQFSNYTVGDEGSEPDPGGGGHNDTGLTLHADFGENSKYEIGATYCHDEEDNLTAYVWNNTILADPYDSILYITILGAGSIVDGPVWDGANYYCNLSLGTECQFTYKAPDNGTGSDWIYITTLAGGGYSAMSVDVYPIYYGERCNWMHAIPRPSDNPDDIISSVTISLWNENMNQTFYTLNSGEFGAFFVGITARDMNVSLTKAGYYPALYLVNETEFDSIVNFTMTVDSDYVPPTIDCPWCFAEVLPADVHEATGGLLNIVTQGVLPGMFIWLMLFIIAIIAFMVVGKLLITGVS
jgi:hypothetical protein